MNQQSRRKSLRGLVSSASSSSSILIKPMSDDEPVLATLNHTNARLKTPVSLESRLTPELVDEPRSLELNDLLSPSTTCIIIKKS